VDKPLPEEALQTILDASVRAANASNMQSYSIVPERHLALNENWKAGGHAHYLDWYFKEWLGDAKPTETEGQMLRLRKRSGFVELQRT
jgi:hypothetical protein